MARVEYTFTFTNAQPGASVGFNAPVFNSASDTSVDGPRLVLDDDNTVAVWSDAATLTATTSDGRGEAISATATRAAASVTTAQGTAGTNPFATDATGIVYDNETSDLTATDVQAAIDELLARIVALETP